MKRLAAALAVAAASLLAVTVAAPASRAASGLYLEIGGKHHGHDGHRKHWRHRDRDHHRHHRHKQFFGSGLFLNFAPPPQQVQRPCEVIVRDGRFNGRPARIGETLCFDGRGKAYVVQGSGFLVEYY